MRMSIFCCTFAEKLIIMDNKPYMTSEGWMRPLDTHRHHRETHWDYKGRGVYHLTLVIEGHYPLLGVLDGNNPEEANIILNSFGKKVLERLQDTPRLYAEKGYQLKILASQIMPDHVHVAIQVLEPLPRTIGTVIRGFKSACTSLYKKEYYNCPNDGTKVHDEGEKNIVHFSRIFTRTESIWEQIPEHYHERILHTSSHMDDMIAYIKDNPRRLAIKKAHPDLFKICEEQVIRGVRMRVLGNRFLLERPIRETLRCSRSLTQEEINTLQEECLDQAEKGTIYVSAAISNGEKQICRTLREAGYPLIIIPAEGFPKEDDPHFSFYKPKGVYFEACANGKLLLVEPDAEELERPDVVAKVAAKIGDIPHDSKRWKFMAMNEIAEVLSQ